MLETPNEKGLNCSWLAGSAFSELMEDELDDEEDEA